METRTGRAVMRFGFDADAAFVIVRTQESEGVRDARRDSESLDEILNLDAPLPSGARVDVMLASPILGG